MGKVRFSCPRCQAVMQTNEDKVGFDINCPQCSHRFTLVGQSSKTETSSSESAANITEETRQWASTPVAPAASDANVAKTPPSQVGSTITPASRQTIPPIYQGSTSNFSCPHCQTRQPPIWKSEVSTAGWITFVILLFTTCFFCWVGLLIRDKYTVCSACSARLPRPFL